MRRFQQLQSLSEVPEISLVHNRIEVEADIMFHEVLEAEGAMYVLPGGMPGTLHLKDHEGLGKLLQKAYKNEKYLAASVQHQQYLKNTGF